MPHGLFLHSRRTQDSQSEGRTKNPDVRHRAFVQQVYWTPVLGPGSEPSGSLEPQELPASMELPSINSFEGSEVGVCLALSGLVPSATSLILPGQLLGCHTSPFPFCCCGCGRASVSHTGHSCREHRPIPKHHGPCLPVAQPLTLPGEYAPFCPTKCGV